ncbi:hypothetical protein ACFQ60_04130 [Streptomyces zhihengii]
MNIAVITPSRAAIPTCASSTQGCGTEADAPTTTSWSRWATKRCAR